MTDDLILIRDKYAGDRTADLSADLARLKSGEPLAYVIGWIPFLGLRIGLDSKPLIPRPETEWWTESLVEHLTDTFGNTPFSLLDLCAGSGAIGLAVLASFPHARVTFGELRSAHVAQIRANLEANGLDAARAQIRQSDLFAGFPRERFDIIASNPPYVPATRILDESVTDFEPAEALYAGTDGLDLIRRIARETAHHLTERSELWLECDIANIEETVRLVREGGAKEASIRNDVYGRPRIIVGYYE